MNAGRIVQTHPQQIPGIDDATRDAADDLTTPDALVRAILAAEFPGRDRFDLDAAADAVNAKAAAFITEQQDSLVTPWTVPGVARPLVLLNPPWSMLEQFLARAWNQLEHTLGIAVIVPARVSEAWWAEHVELHRSRGLLEVRFPRGRCRFGLPADLPRDPRGERPSEPIALLIMSPDHTMFPARRYRFEWVRGEGHYIVVTGAAGEVFRELYRPVVPRPRGAR